MTQEERKGAFNTIDKDNSGSISFGEWTAHFGELVKSTNMSMDEVGMMFSAYEADSPGVNFEEYTSFMNDVFGK